MSQHVGVAISGGGCRAAMWGLGTLLYLVDSGRHAEVGVVSSVSGGSITNGVVAHEVDLPNAGPAAFDDAVRPLVRNVAYTGLFPLAPATRVYVLSVFALLAAGLVALAGGIAYVLLEGLRWSGGGLLLAALVLLVVAARWFERRSVVTDKALRRLFFSRDGVTTPLASIDRNVDHVFCATELQSGGHVYFSPKFLYSYKFGLGRPAGLPLATAVQCSACLPGAFSVRRFRAADHFAANDDRDLALVDGGVYDNMADQWLDGLAERVGREPSLPLVARGVDEMIVVNASALAGWTAFPKARLVLLAELLTLKRVSSVMYEVTTARRRYSLVQSWMRNAAAGAGPRGALVHIAQTPYTVADQMLGSADQAMAARARHVIDLLGGDAARDRWKQRAAASKDVPTVLRKLGRETTLDLLEHAYVLAACNLHVLLGYPLTALPRRERFSRLIDQ